MGVVASEISGWALSGVGHAVRSLALTAHLPCAVRPVVCMICA